MKYIAPYGVADPNAPYINGNPATGTNGSIPPAAAFEHPLRELAALIANAGFTPTDTDLAQVTRAVRQGINFLTATAIGGNPNTLQASFTGGPPPIATYQPGLRLNVAIPANNTGPTTLAIDGLTQHTIKRANGADLAADDLRGGMVASLIYDGTNFQLTNFQGFTSSTTNNNTFTINIPYIADTGATNAINAPFSPAITSLAAGLLILVKLNHTLTGPCTIVVNANPSKAVTRLDGNPTQLNDAFLGEMLLLAYTGSTFQIINMIGVPPTAALLAAQDFYVNGSTGNDSNDGRAATVGGGHGPFATINRGVSETLKYNMNGYEQTIHVANQTYNERVVLPQTNGAGQVNLLGNTGSPDSVVIQGPSGRTAVYMTGGNYTIDGFKVVAGTGGSVSGDAQDCIDVDAGVLFIYNVTFGTAVRAHVICGYSSQVIIGDGTIKIAGNATAHIWATLGATLTFPVPLSSDWPLLNISAACNFSDAFARADYGSTCQIRYQSISGFANATGKKFNANTNGNVTTNGGGASYLPGDSAGVTSTGGQYS